MGTEDTSKAMGQASAETRPGYSDIQHVHADPLLTVDSYQATSEG